MVRYNLYLDESKYIESGNRHTWYCLAGFAIATDKRIVDFRLSLGELKKQLWSEEASYTAKNHILHEAEIRGYSKKSNRIDDSGYEIFSKMENVRTVVSGVERIMKENKLMIFGCVIDETAIELSYKNKQNSYSAYKICLQTIIENYAHFLKNINGVGNVILESRRNIDGAIQDVRTRKQFYKIMTHGTNLYTPYDLQNTIYKLAFIKKQENDAGLQIADFIPRPFILHNVGQPQRKPSLYQTIRKQRYGGLNNDPGTFGVVVIK